MSTPSKRRRQARAWMTEERKRHEADALRRAQLARTDADRDWERRLTRIIPPDDRDTFYPQGRLEQPFLRIHAPDRTALAMRFEPDDMRHMYARNVWTEIVPIVAKQMAMVLPNGAKVVWWTWEMGR